MQDSRWIQRLQILKRTNILLQSNLTVDQPCQLERAGIIQFYEMAFVI